MTGRRTIQESEEFAKNWQIDSVMSQVEDNETSRKTDTQEIKDLIKGIDDKIDKKVVTKDKLDSEIKLIHKEYAPTKKAVWWLAATLGLLIITYFFQLFVNISKVVGQS